MKKTCFFVFAFALAVPYATAHAQCFSCLSTPVAMKIGVKPGITVCNYDPNAAVENDQFAGAGFHFGLGMGADFFRLVGFDLTPGYRSTSFSRDELLGRRTYSYGNLMFPMFLSLKGGMIPLVSPYVGVGIGFNIQFSGVERFEFSNGSAIENDLGGAGLQGFVLLGIGAEVKLLKWRIVPEFLYTFSGSGEDSSPQTEEKDFDISVGFYYAP